MSGARPARVLLVVAAVIGALLVVGVLSTDERAGPPYDPASTGPEGTKALVELVEGFGAEAEVVTTFPVDADVVIAFGDTVPDSREEEVRRWVGAGRTLVLTDPRSELTPLASPTGSFAETVNRGDCDIEALAGLQTIALGEESAVLRYEPARGMPVCFADENGAFIALVPEGAGRIVSLASPSLFQNQNLDAADNAAVATALVAPRPGTRVAIVTDDTFPGPKEPPEPGDAFSRLLDAYPNVRLLLLQLLVALAVLALVAARRLGRPVSEPQPVAIPGSALVEAVGRLLRQRRDPESAARMLRAHGRRTVAERSALPAHTPPPVLADTVAARTGRPAADTLAVLDGRPLASDAELVDLADQIDTVVEEVSHGRSP